MKKVIFLIGFVLFAMQSHAQIELTLKQKMMIKDVIEERVPGVKYLKVHKPGDNFLFFKRYQKLF